MKNDDVSAKRFEGERLGSADPLELVRQLGCMNAVLTHTGSIEQLVGITQPWETNAYEVQKEGVGRISTPKDGEVCQRASFSHHFGEG